VAENPSYYIDWLYPAHCRPSFLPEALRWSQESMAAPREECNCAKKSTSVAMNEWLRYATPAARIHLDPEHTVHGLRAGSATAAKKLKVDVAEICLVADWELTGKELNKAFYHRDKECEPHLSRLFFADLLA
jgi:hypothetical protein